MYTWARRYATAIYADIYTYLHVYTYIPTHNDAKVQTYIHSHNIYKCTY